MIHQWNGFHEYYTMEIQKYDFIWKVKHAYLSASAVMFGEQCLAYVVHIDWCYKNIHKHTSKSQHISVDCVN